MTSAMQQDEIDRACPIMPVLEQQTCSICLCNIRAVCRELPCFHAFCPHCIDPWIREKRTCPQCRGPVVRRVPDILRPTMRRATILPPPVLRDVEPLLAGNLWLLRAATAAPYLYYATTAGHFGRDPALTWSLRGKAMVAGGALVLACIASYCASW